MSWTFELTSKAVEQFQDLEPELRKRIKGKLEFWQVQENPLFFSRPTPHFKTVTHRFRIGKYRVIVAADQMKKTMVVVKIGLRDKVYKNIS